MGILLIFVYDIQNIPVTFKALMRLHAYVALAY